MRDSNNDPFRMHELMDDEDDAEGQCREDDTNYIEPGYVVDDETGKVPGVDLDGGERVDAESVELTIEGDDAEAVETAPVEEASVGFVDPEEFTYDDDLDAQEFRYESGDVVYEGEMTIEFDAEPQDLLDALRLMHLLNLTDQ